MRFHSAACRFNGHSERPFQPCHGSVFKSSSCCQGKSFQGIRQSLIDRASILCSKGVGYLQSKPYLLWTCCASSCSTQRGCLLYWACNQNHWRPRRPPECCGFTSPSERLLTDAAFHESAGRLDPSSRRFAVSLARFSAKNSWPESTLGIRNQIPTWPCVWKQKMRPTFAEHFLSVCAAAWWTLHSP